MLLGLKIHNVPKKLLFMVFDIFIYRLACNLAL